LYLHFLYTDTSSTYIYTLSLHDALPISFSRNKDTFPYIPHNLQSLEMAIDAVNHNPSNIKYVREDIVNDEIRQIIVDRDPNLIRSEEHTSELQSRENLVCRLLLEKKKKN